VESEFDQAKIITDMESMIKNPQFPNVVQMDWYFK
jgi:hypothetical protein